MMDAVDLHAAASRAEIALRDDETGKPLCIVLRNFDGEYGRRTLAAATLNPAEFMPPNCPRMAEPNRISSVTTGTTEGNDIFQLLCTVESPHNHEVLRLARQAVSIVEKGAPSLIFAQPEAGLECRLRAHAFPPKDPSYTPGPASTRVRRHSMDADGTHLERCTDEREGGRLHGHCDEDGTDAVVLLNMGACSLFLDTNETEPYTYYDEKKNKWVSRKRPICTAQRTKECWCVGNNGLGHWCQRHDVAERYCEGDSYRLLRDRLCGPCASGGQGHSCPRCKTVHLRSGDLVVFSGKNAFHGVHKVEVEQPPQDRRGLPAWARDFLDRGYRLSVQWRLTNSVKAAAKRATDAEAWQGQGGSHAQPAAAGAASGHGALAAVLAALAAGHTLGGSASGAFDAGPPPATHPPVAAPAAQAFSGAGHTLGGATSGGGPAALGGSTALGSSANPISLDEGDDESDDGDGESGPEVLSDSEDEAPPPAVGEKRGRVASADEMRLARLARFDTTHGA